MRTFLILAALLFLYLACLCLCHAKKFLIRTEGSDPPSHGLDPYPHALDPHGLDPHQQAHQLPTEDEEPPLEEMVMDLWGPKAFDIHNQGTRIVTGDNLRRRRGRKKKFNQHHHHRG